MILSTPFCLNYLMLVFIPICVNIIWLMEDSVALCSLLIVEFVYEIYACITAFVPFFLYLDALSIFSKSYQSCTYRLGDFDALQRLSGIMLETNISVIEPGDVRVS